MSALRVKFPVWRIALSDFVITLTTTLAVQFVWPTSGTLVLSGLNLPGKVTPTYTAVSLLIAAMWWISLWQIGSWRENVLGYGTSEYSKVARATFFTFTVIALISYLTKAQVARGYLLLALPVGLALILTSRWVWRKVLIVNRKRGNFRRTAVIIGSPKSADTVCEKLSQNDEVGLQVQGAFLSQHLVPLSQSQQLSLPRSGVPIWGGLDDLIPTIRGQNIDSVIVASADELSPSDVRKLGWELLPSREKLYLAANIVDVAGPRLSIKPVAGLPLIEVDQPQFEGTNRILKRWLDIFMGLIILILTIPLFLIAAIHIKMCDGHKIFFTQDRIGRFGKPFKIFKFRTMSSVAEREQANIDLAEHDLTGNTVLFKLKDDPRVTPAGRWLRRFSVDELPQLLNVLIGNMSLVGPRPPLAKEVELYDSYVYSRFIVKPGMTGLWQISGRSELSWEESIRADLSYVQNWSIMFDLVILWRTMKAVVTGRGAY